MGTLHSPSTSTTTMCEGKKETTEAGPAAEAEAAPATAPAADPNHGATAEEMKQLLIVQEMMSKGELTLDEGIRRIMELSGQAGIVEEDMSDSEEDIDDEEDEGMEDDEQDIPATKKVRESLDNNTEETA